MGEAKKSGDFSWGFLIHLGMHMWGDAPLDRSKYAPRESYRYADTNLKLRCDDAIWRECVDKLAVGGIDTLIIDVGEGVVYPSHPELAIEGSWTPDKLRNEIRRLRALGVEAIPKLNFSTTHDAWLKEYGHMVSTPEYYKVCSDVIGDLMEIFDHPRLFHIGMEEEYTDKQQRGMSYMCLRRGELWWHDFYFLVQEVEKRGARAWAWNDLADFRDRLPEMYAKMPKSVMQSPCFYGLAEDLDKPFKYDHERKRLEFMIELDQHGYDQFPVGTIWCPSYYAKDENNDTNISRLARFCVKRLSSERLKGVMMAPWVATSSPHVEKLRKSIAFIIASRREILNSQGSRVI